MSQNQTLLMPHKGKIKPFEKLVVMETPSHGTQMTLATKCFLVIVDRYSFKNCVLGGKLCQYVRRRHRGSSFDMLCNGCLTLKQAIFHISSGRNDKQMIITGLTWLKKFGNIACFQIHRIIKRFLCSRSAAQC